MSKKTRNKKIINKKPKKVKKIITETLENKTKKLIKKRIEEQKGLLEDTPTKFEKGYIYRQKKYFKTITDKNGNKRKVVKYKWIKTTPRNYGKQFDKDIKKLKVSQKIDIEFRKKYDKNIKTIINQVKKNKNISKTKESLLNRYLGTLINPTNRIGLDNDEYCYKLKLELNNLYKKRSRRNEKLKQKHLTKTEIAELKREIRAISIRIEIAKSEKFICSKRYTKIKIEEKKLKKYYKNLVKKLKSKRTDENQKKLIKIELRVVKEYLIKLEQVDKINIEDVDEFSGEISFETKGGEWSQTDVIFVLNDDFNNWVSSGVYNNIIIDGESFEIPTELIACQLFLTEKISWAEHFQYVYSTPMYKAIGNVKKSTLKIFVEEFTYGNVND